jgi:hypothetical protein
MPLFASKPGFANVPVLVRCFTATRNLWCGPRGGGEEAGSTASAPNATRFRRPDFYGFQDFLLLLLDLILLCLRERD